MCPAFVASLLYFDQLMFLAFSCFLQMLSLDLYFGVNTHVESTCTGAHTHMYTRLQKCYAIGHLTSRTHMQICVLFQSETLTDQAA